MYATNECMSDKNPEQSQADKFRELARELETNEDEAAFEEAVRKIANAAPQAPKAHDDQR